MRHHLLTFGLLVLAVPALADQQAWVSRADADRAAVLLPPGSTVRLYCLPCEDESWTEVEVARVEVEYTGSGDYWEVLVNDQGIDLAYAYVELDGQWEDLALLLGLEATGVPRFLGSRDADPSAELAAAEREIAHLEASLAGSAGAAARKLDRARKAWSRYVDAQVEAEAVLAGSPERVTEARLRLTRARIAELENLLSLGR